MIRLLLLLCATIFVVLLVGGRDQGQVRYGLIPGKIAPLRPEKSLASAEVVEVAATESSTAKASSSMDIVETELAENPAPSADPVDETALITTTSFDLDADANTQAGLTLALPLVEAGAEEAIATVAEPVAETLPEAVPEVQYVVGTSVNVRQGPSAETESLAKLARGEAVSVSPSDTPGWSKITIEGDGVEGYVASRFLSGTPETSLFGDNN